MQTPTYALIVSVHRADGTQNRSIDFRGIPAHCARKRTAEELRMWRNTGFACVRRDRGGWTVNECGSSDGVDTWRYELVQDGVYRSPGWRKDTAKRRTRRQEQWHKAG